MAEPLGNSHEIDAHAQPVQQGVQQMADPSAEPASSGRDTRGRFTPGNLAALVHGVRSRQVQAAALPEQSEALAALVERRQSIERDLGGSDSLSVLTRDMVNRYLELSVVADYLGGRLVTEGPLTTKGRQRAALTAYLGVVDRQTKIATTLGLQRRLRSVADMSISEYLEHEQQQRKLEQEQETHR